MAVRPFHILCGERSPPPQLQGRLMASCLILTEADWKPQVVVLPIPVPIFVPVPMNMYCQKIPVPFSMPVPVSVNLFCSVRTILFWPLAPLMCFPSFVGACANVPAHHAGEHGEDCGDYRGTKGENPIQPPGSRHPGHG